MKGSDKHPVTLIGYSLLHVNKKVVTMPPGQTVAFCCIRPTTTLYQRGPLSSPPLTTPSYLGLFQNFQLSLFVEPFSSILREKPTTCLLYTSPSPRDGLLSRMPSSA